MKERRKDVLRSLDCVCSLAHHDFKLRKRNPEYPILSVEERWRNKPRRVPLILKHPETSRLAIYGRTVENLAFFFHLFQLTFGLNGGSKRFKGGLYKSCPGEIKGWWEVSTPAPAVCCGAMRRLEKSPREMVLGWRFHHRTLENGSFRSHKRDRSWMPSAWKGWRRAKRMRQKLGTRASSGEGYIEA